MIIGGGSLGMREALKQNVEGCSSRLTGNHNQELKLVKGLTRLSGIASPDAQEHRAHSPQAPHPTPHLTPALFLQVVERDSVLAGARCPCLTHEAEKIFLSTGPT